MNRKPAVKRAAARIFVAVLAALALAATVSCKSAEPAPDRRSAAPAPAAKYPADRFIVAEGTGEKSFQEAEENARARVAAQIRSTLEAETKVVVSEINRGGKVTGSQEIVDVVLSKTTYERGQLIRTDPTLQRKEGGRYCAFAYLSLAEAYQAPSESYRTAAATFRQAARSAAGCGDDLAGFTASFRQAQGCFSSLASCVGEIRAVTQRDYEPWTQDLATYQSLEADRVGRLRALRLAVEVAGPAPESVRSTITSALTRALTDLGLTAAPGACDPGGYALRVVPTVREVRGSFGPQAAMTMTGALVHCASGKTLAEIDLSDPSFKGMHSHDPDRALAALLAKVTPDALRPRLAAGLGPVLPIDAGGK